MENLPQISNQLSIKELQEVSKIVCHSNLFSGIKTPEQVFTLMMLCQAKNLHAIEALERYDLIQGRPAMKAVTIVAEFQKSGGTLEYLEYTDEKVTVKVSHPSGGSLTNTWDIARAKQAGLANKDVWKSYPKAMLANRAVTEAIRRVFPACLFGMSSTEEVMDLIDVTTPPAPSITLPRTAKRVVKAEESELAEIVEAPTLSKEDHSVYVDNIRTALSFVPAVRRAEVVTNLKLQYNVKSLTEITDAEKQQEVLNLITDASEPDQVATS